MFLNSFGSVFLFGFGFVIGFRHGFDIDHVAAISNLVGSSKQHKRGLFLAFLYSLGHGIVVVALGIALFMFGSIVPQSLESLLEKAVGITLIGLGLYLFYSMIRTGKMVSRWEPVKKGLAILLKKNRLLKNKSSAIIALAVGALHGIGAETPTQIAALSALVGLRGVSGGLFLALFVVGIFVSNMTVAVGILLGFLSVNKNRLLFNVFGAIVAISSIWVGLTFFF